MCTLSELNNGFMQVNVCVIHLISLHSFFLQNIIQDYRLPLPAVSCCHSAFNAFKSSHSTVASLFKIVTVYYRKYFPFMKLLFIDCCCLQCSSRGAGAGDKYEAKRGSEQALLCSQSHAHCWEGESSV